MALLVVNAAFFIRHFEKNSRTKKLKTQGKNSITQGKNSKVLSKVHRFVAQKQVTVLLRSNILVKFGKNCHMKIANFLKTQRKTQGFGKTINAENGSNKKGCVNVKKMKKFKKKIQKSS